MWDLFLAQIVDFAAHIKKYRKLSVCVSILQSLSTFGSLRPSRCSDRCAVFTFGPTQGWSGHTGKEQIVPELEEEVFPRKRKSLKKFKKHKCVVKEKYAIR